MRLLLILASHTLAVRAFIAPSSPRQPLSLYQEEPDLFEYFDPLLSPHAYPNGINPSQKGDRDKDDPLKLSKVGPSIMRSNSDLKQQDIPIDTNQVFDPRISPHAYTTGEVPNTFVGDTPEPSISVKTVGILLMDHGSRNEASNRRLHALADMYRQFTRSTNVIVAAAHMEIAKPSIPDGLQTLLDQGVDEIVCHPYFLSPGRHVQEDIPQIIEEAIQTMKIEIPVSTTDPVGSQTEIMLGAIDSLVHRASSNLNSR